MDHDVRRPGRAPRPPRRRPRTSAARTVICRLKPGEPLQHRQVPGVRLVVAPLAAGAAATRCGRAGRGRATPAGTACSPSSASTSTTSGTTRRRRDRRRRRAPAGRPRSALFHVLQAGARAERRAIAAKGLTGDGLRRPHVLGHRDVRACPCCRSWRPRPRPTRCAGGRRSCRWPTSAPSSSASAGAAFPWRTIRGDECSGYWPAGTAAFHINADIADAVRRYVAATGDVDFEREVGPGAAGRDRAAVALAGPPRLVGRVPHRRRHRPRRVHAPSSTTTCTRTSWRSRTCASPPTPRRGTTAPRPSSASTPRRWPAGATRPTAMRIPFDEVLGVHPQSEGFTRPPDVGLRGHPAREVPAAAARSLLRPVPQAGRQAGRPGAGDACCGRTRSRRSRWQRNFAYYEARDRARLVALGVHPGRRSRPWTGHLDLAYDYLARVGAGRPRRPRRQLRPRRAHRVDGRARGPRSSAGSAVCSATPPA